MENRKVLIEQVLSRAIHMTQSPYGFNAKAFIERIASAGFIIPTEVLRGYSKEYGERRKVTWLGGFYISDELDGHVGNFDGDAVAIILPLKKKNE